VQRSGRCVVRELGDGGGDPAPGVRAVVIADGRELVNARAAFVKRFVAVALHHQIGGSPNIDLGYHAAKNCRLAVEKRLTPLIAWLSALRVKVAADGIEIDR
jgi:hypothetical protein